MKDALQMEPPAATKQELTKVRTLNLLKPEDVTA